MSKDEVLALLDAAEFTKTANTNGRRAFNMIYLADGRPEVLGDDEAIFLGKTYNPINRHSVRRMLQRCGEQAGVKDVHPPKFRHTFAIEYLRGGGNPYVLPGILGHSSMDMTHYYLQIAQVDLQNFHKAASPVAR